MKQRKKTSLLEVSVNEMPKNEVVKGAVGYMYGRRGSTETETCMFSWEHPQKGLVATRVSVQEGCRYLRMGEKAKVKDGILFERI